MEGISELFSSVPQPQTIQEQKQAREESAKETATSEAVKTSDSGFGNTADNGTGEYVDRTA
jgi:hypothetical protein